MISKKILKQVVFGSLVWALALSGCSKNTLPANVDITGSKPSAIMGGEPVAPDSLYAKATVFLTSSRSAKDAFCSGVLVAKRVVLTAAHCIDDKVFVGFGFGKLNAQATFIESVLAEQNPDYHSSAKKDRNDVGIVILAEDAPAGYEPVPLLPASYEVKSGLELMLAGYGYTENNRDDMSPNLLVTKESVDHLVGENEYYSDESHGHGSCNGDSGGPSYVTVDGKAYVLGLVSWGDTECEAYGYYTIAGHYADWVNEVVANNIRN